MHLAANFLLTFAKTERTIVAARKVSVAEKIARWTLDYSLGLSNDVRIDEF